MREKDAMTDDDAALTPPMSDELLALAERRTFCPEDGRACYTPDGPEPEGFRCANYGLCKSFERQALQTKEERDE